jgi:hypothetical protein
MCEKAQSRRQRERRRTTQKTERNLNLEDACDSTLPVPHQRIESSIMKILGNSGGSAKAAMGLSSGRNAIAQQTVTRK